MSHRTMSFNSQPPVSVPHTYSLDKSISAIAGSPDGKLIAVVGRDILQTMRWKSREHGENRDQWELVKNFRVGRLNLNYSSVDVQWNPKFPQYIGTAATNGAIIIWNVNRDAKKQERVIKEHMRAVNRICWQKSDGNLLLSASQDGTVRLFDLRDSSVAAIFSTSNTEVRDVQFHPFHSNYFASANDGGTIQVWDIRKTGKDAIRQVITAHQGLILSIDWHPSENYKNLIASAGRDRLIKVWDLKDDSSSSLHAAHIIQTVASVGRVKWRPNFPSQLCSTASVVDPRVHIWDTKHPNIPVYSLDSHKDVVTSFIFDSQDNQSNTLISASKDGSIKRFKIKSDAYKHFDHIPNSVVAWLPSNQITYAFESIVRPSKNRAQWLSSSVSALNFDSRTSFEAHSSHELFGPSIQTGAVRTLKTSSLVGSQAPMYEMFNSEHFQYFAKEYKLYGATLSEMLEYNHQVAVQIGEMEIAQVWAILKLLFCVESSKKAKPKRSTDSFWDAYYDIIFDEPFSISSFDEQDSTSVLSSEPEIEQDFLMRMDPASLEDSIFEQTAHQTPNFAPAMKKHINNEVGTFIIPDFSFHATVNQMLRYHAEKGDVQTSVTVLVVLGKKFNFPLDERSKWTLSYIELLHRFELFTVANSVIKECNTPTIRSLNQKGTTLQIGCSVCKKTLSKKGWICQKCNTTKCCSLCLQPVKGLYVWCQGCGHGGHLGHMKDWFCTRSNCPVAGCEHKCDLSSPQI